jgi:hypothetical protein
VRVSKRQRERIVRLAEEVAEKAAKNLTRWKSTVYRSRSTGEYTVVHKDPAGRAALKATGTAVVMRD